MNKHLIMLCMITAIFLQGQSVQATTLFYDDFSADIPGQPQSELVNWNVVQGNVDVLGTSYPDCPSTGTNCIDLDGTFSADPAIIETKMEFSFMAGFTYELFFYIPALNTVDPTLSEDDAFMVTVGSFYSETFSGYSAPLSVTRLFSPVSDGTATIQFEMLVDPDNAGPLLSVVSLTQVPIPAAIWLFSSGLLGLFGIARRKEI